MGFAFGMVAFFAGTYWGSFILAIFLSLAGWAIGTLLEGYLE